jgi:hypothetical protein
MAEDINSHIIEETVEASEPLIAQFRKDTNIDVTLRMGTLSSLSNDDPSFLAEVDETTYSRLFDHLDVSRCWAKKINWEQSKIHTFPDGLKMTSLKSEEFDAPHIVLESPIQTIDIRVDNRQYSMQMRGIRQTSIPKEEYKEQVPLNVRIQYTKSFMYLGKDRENPELKTGAFMYKFIKYKDGKTLEAASCSKLKHSIEISILHVDEYLKDLSDEDLAAGIIEKMIQLIGRGPHLKPYALTVVSLTPPVMTVPQILENSSSSSISGDSANTNNTHKRDRDEEDEEDAETEPGDEVGGKRARVV